MTGRLLDEIHGLHYSPNSGSRIRAFAARLTVLLVTAAILGGLLVVASAFTWGAMAIAALLLGIAPGLAWISSRRHGPQSPAITSLYDESVRSKLDGSEVPGQLRALAGTSKQAPDAARLDRLAPVGFGPRPRWMLAAPCAIGTIVGIVTIVALSAGYSPADNSGATPPSSTSVSRPPPVMAAAEFVVPVDGDEVESPFLARGSANLPDNYSLWILTKPDDNRYYTVNTSPLIIDRENRWVFSMGIGRGPEDAGRSYDLFLVAGVADSNRVSMALRDRGNATTVSFDALPEDVTTLDSVRVTLADPNSDANG